VRRRAGDRVDQRLQRLLVHVHLLLAKHKSETRLFPQEDSIPNYVFGNHTMQLLDRQINSDFKA
jgi:hypothetical protein